MYTLSTEHAEDLSLSPENLELLEIKMVRKNTYHLISNNQSIIAHVVKIEGKTVTLQSDKKLYQVTIKDPSDLLIEEMGFELNSVSIINDLKSPMPGLVFDLMVGPGQEVKEGDPLLILEAMKMENMIKAPRDGIIESVSVAKNDPVEKGQVLVSFKK